MKKFYSKKSIAVVLVLVLVLAFCVNTAGAAGAINTSLAKQVFPLVNKERAAVGATALEWNPTLEKAAQIRAKEVAILFDHKRPDGSDWSTVSPDAHGENIAYGQSSAADVMRAWMKSPGHKANILKSSYISIGIACYELNGIKYWVQLFSFNRYVAPKPVPLEKVAISPTSASVEQTKTKQLSVTLTPSNTTESKTAAWKSSNTQVATVSTGGLVTGKAPGTATITCTVANKSATCKITVTPAVAVTGIKLNRTTVTIPQKTTSVLKAVVSPTNATNKGVTWTSSNKNIASVDSKGNVTGKKAGRCTITATTKSGGKTAKCTVFVGPKVTSIRLNRTRITIAKGRSTTLTANIAPINAADKHVIWKSNKTNIASISKSGQITANAKGKCTISATTRDGRKVAKCIVAVA